MTDKEYRKQKKRVMSLFNKWCSPMGLKWYEIDMVWVRELRSDKDKISQEYTAAEVKSQWQYRQAQMTWYLPEIEPLSDDKLERIVVHEMCHILMGPLSEYAPEDKWDERELATQNMAIAYLWVREAGKKDK